MILQRMFPRPENRPVWIALLLIAVIVTWTSSNINWEERRAPRIIKVDGNGYYAYLPAIMIYHDLHFGFFEEIAAREGYQNMGYDYRYILKGHVVNKYFAGTALAQLPFFLAAHGLSLVSGLPPDGYSQLYLIFINLASIFYLLLACVFMDKLLQTYRIRPVNRAVAIFCMVFGTNVFYYTAFEPSMSHVYSLAFTTWFAWSARRYFMSNRSSFLWMASIALGIIFLIRPVNVLVIAAVPFLAGDWNAITGGLKRMIRKPVALIIAALVMAIPVSIQFIIYKLQTGDWWVYSYGQERFLFGQPHILSMWFSYRKGLFVYAPLLLAALLAGGFYLSKAKKYFEIACWLGFFIILTYVLSSWHQWYYGGSFGSRVYIEFFFLFAILLGFGLESMKKGPGKSVFIGLLGLLIVFSLIQTAQYYYGHFHWSEMDRQKYWDVFQRMDELI